MTGWNVNIDKKTINPYFSDVWNGLKTFEIRHKLPNLQVGDLVTLEEFEDGKYTGRKILVEVTYLIDSIALTCLFDIQEFSNRGMVVFGFKILKKMIPPHMIDDVENSEVA